MASPHAEDRPLPGQSHHQELAIGCHADRTPEPSNGMRSLNAERQPNLLNNTHDWENAGKRGPPAN